MGVGYPHQIVEAVKRGVDMFDCVIPSREARHGRIYSWNEKVDFASAFAGDNDKSFYNVTNIKKQEYKFDLSSLNANSRFVELKNCSKAYLRHLFIIEYPLAQRIATLNNLEFYLEMMERVRKVVSME
jgi:queuine tRNA-ribosyltransferase